MNQSERILQLEAEVKRYRYALEQASDRPHALWCDSVEYQRAPCSCEAEAINNKISDILSTPTPSTSGILELARAARKLAYVGVNDFEGEESAEKEFYYAMDALSPEEIKLLEGHAGS